MTAEIRRSSEREALPCLFSNNSIESPSEAPVEALSTQTRKSASALAWNVAALAEKHGLENLGFLTLTFKDFVTDFKEAQRRFNSLATNVIRKRYEAWIAVMERCKTGRIHYHLVVVVGKDIRTGVNFDEISNRNYRSAGPVIRSEWAFWRETAPKYRFGRTELLPVKSTQEGIARYVGKYISKHMSCRSNDDKGARLVRYSKHARHASTRFMFLTDGSAAWRRKVRMFAQLVSETYGTTPDFQGLRDALGPRWAHNNRQFIADLPDLPADQVNERPESTTSPAVQSQPHGDCDHDYCDVNPRNHPEDRSPGTTTDGAGSDPSLRQSRSSIRLGERTSCLGRIHTVGNLPSAPLASDLTPSSNDFGPPVEQATSRT